MVVFYPNLEVAYDMQSECYLYIPVLYILHTCGLWQTLDTMVAFSTHRFAAFLNLERSSREFVKCHLCIVEQSTHELVKCHLMRVVRSSVIMAHAQ